MGTTIAEAMRIHAAELADEIWGDEAERRKKAGKPIGPRPEWHVILTEPQREATTATRLGDVGYHVYVPFFMKSVRQNYFKKRDVTTPIFPGYLFMAIDVRDEWLGRHYSEIRITPGVRDFMRFPSGNLVRLNNREIKRLKRAERQIAEQANMKVGQTVEIEDDLWAGRLAKIDRLDDRGRIGVLIELFGRLTPVEVSVNQVRVVLPP